MRRSPAALIVVAMLVSASCSGDDDTTTTTTATPTTDMVETTATPPATATPTTAATVPPTTQPPTTTGPTVTDTTPPTTSEPVDERFAVLEAVEAASAASRAALRDPFNDDKLAALDGFFTGPQLEGWQNVIANYREENLRQIENTEEPDAILVGLASVTVNEQGTFATLQACSITSGIVVETGGNPDGSDRVIEDRIGRNVVEFDIVKDDDHWKLESARSPDESERIASCD